MSEAAIRTVAEFHEQLRQLNTKGETRFLYRGQSNADWPVNCSAARRLTTHTPSLLENPRIRFLLIGYLEELIGRARMRGFLPGDSREPPSDLELMAQLQHQGAATGLMDFTRQPLVALWFACNGSGDKDGAIAVLSGSKTEEIYRKDDLERKIRAFFEEDKLWSWEPAALGNRIVAQSSVFIFGVPTIDSAGMKRLAVQARSKNDILNELETVYGISEEMLFSDFSGYAIANAFNKTFDSNRAIRYWHEQINTATDVNEKATAYFNCGVTYCTIQDFNRAIGEYDAAISLNPQYAEAYNDRGNIKIHLGQYEEALKDCDEAVRLNPQDAAAYHNRGSAKIYLDQHEEALKDYSEAIRLNPRFTPAYNNRGTAKQKLGWNEEARKDFQKGLALAKERGETELAKRIQEELDDLESE